MSWTEKSTHLIIFTSISILNFAILLCFSRDVNYLVFKVKLFYTIPLGLSWPLWDTARQACYTHTPLPQNVVKFCVFYDFPLASLIFTILLNCSLCLSRFRSMVSNFSFWHDDLIMVTEVTAKVGTGTKHSTDRKTLL